MNSTQPLPSPTTTLPTTPRSPSSKHQSPRDNYNQTSSPAPAPASPLRDPLIVHTAYGAEDTRNMAASGTFFADSPAVEHGPDHDDLEDPHDLSFSSNHILRASMVDNLVMSLDQFSHVNFDDPPHTPRSNSYDPTINSRLRKRGHTLSSSVSSEGDAYDLRTIPKIPDTVPRIPPRTSVRHPKNIQNVPKLPSIFGEDEDSVRAKVYDAQRAPAPASVRRKKNTSTGGKSNASSNSSSIDLGHLASLSGRLGAAGKRRSRSFDFGSRQKVARNIKATAEADGAPTPVVFAGPEAQNGPTASMTALPLIRKNSNKSSKSAHVKKSRSTALGTSTVKNTADPIPQMPTVRPVANHSASSQEQKTASTPLQESVPAARPGFFRRVFGSSRNPVVHADLQPKSLGRSTPVQDDPPPPSTPTARHPKTVRRTSTDASANKENQPVLTKKSSAFFRRRKKSFSTTVPPPLPLTLSSELKADPEPVVDGTSPVSSLRAFMDPYLTENQTDVSPAHGRTNSMQGFFTPKLPPPAFALPNQGMGRRSFGHDRTGSHGSNKTLKSAQKPSSNLRIPHQDSFLASSSSTASIDEPIKKPPLEHSNTSDSDRSAIRNKKSVSELQPERSASYSSINSSSPNPRKTIPRQKSWRSDRVSLPSTVTTAAQSAPMHTSVDNGSKQSIAKTSSTHLGPGRKDSVPVAFDSVSDLSEYRSAPSTPLIIETYDNDETLLPTPHEDLPEAPEKQSENAEISKAQRIFDNMDEEVDASNVGAWLGEAGPERERIRKAYMELFDWSNQDILDSLRGLCDHVALRGETQQMDRIVDAFSKRWCECNQAHAFKSSDVVHTICYSIVLLNTDLHLADIGQKMTKVQFVRNALPTIVQVAQGKLADKSLRSPVLGSNAKFGAINDSNDKSRTLKKSDHSSRESQHPSDAKQNSGSETGPGRAWEAQIESVLKCFYVSISQEPLPLSGVPIEVNSNLNASNNFLTIGSNMLRRTPSVLSKAHSENTRGRMTGESKSLGARWISKTRSRPRLPSAPGFASSRTSIDEQSSAWSPSMSSTWSKASLGKTLTSMSVDSFGTEANHNDYQSSIGFANALSQAIIREDQLDLPIEDGPRAGALLEDESLELCGAPWAKEGIVKHKCHLEGVDQRSKDRNWNDCFAVIEKGWMRLFSFSMTAKSLRNKARTPKAGQVVGGGNWQENAEEVWKFMLRHTIASSLPPPGYSKARPYVWALSLPTGAVHLFSVGTPEIVKEFVHTANYWSARLSKEPMMGGISNMEYGWSDAVVNRALGVADNHAGANSVISPRPSTQMSMRSSLDHVGGVRARLPGDRAHINEWSPPQQSMFASQLMEVDQFRALQTYVNNVEEELQKHNELRSLMLAAFTTKHPNSTKAMNNWEKKSSYLLREIVKFRTYIDTLQNAQMTKEKIYKTRKEEGDAQRAEIDSRSVNMQV